MLFAFFVRWPSREYSFTIISVRWEHVSDEPTIAWKTLPEMGWGHRLIQQGCIWKRFLGGSHARDWRFGVVAEESGWLDGINAWLDCHSSRRLLVMNHECDINT